MQDSGGSTGETGLSVEDVAAEPQSVALAAGLLIALALVWIFVWRASRPHWRSGGATSGRAVDSSWNLTDYFVGILIFFMGQFLGGAIVGTWADEWRLLSGMVFGGGLSAGYIVLVVTRTYRVELSEIGWRRAHASVVDALVSLGVTAGVLILVGALFTVVQALGMGGILWEQSAFEDVQEAEGKPLLLISITAVFLAPVFEELLFRGFALEILGRRLGTTPALVLSSAIFALVHGEAFIPLFLLGLAFGWLYVWRGSLWAPIGAHFLNNAFSVFLLTQG